LKSLCSIFQCVNLILRIAAQGDQLALKPFLRTTRCCLDLLTGLRI
jgi:hypothetical protein